MNDSIDRLRLVKKKSIVVRVHYVYRDVGPSFNGLDAKVLFAVVMHTGVSVLLVLFL